MGATRGLFIVVVLAMLTSCGAEDRSPSPSPAVAAPSASGGQNVDDVLAFDSIPDIVAAIEPSVVSVLRTDGGEGSGVIWSGDGVIVTNNHVVEGVTEVVVAFADGQRVAGEVMATDPRTDLAIVQADRADLPAATFHDALPRPGELALALGNPIGFENSVTQGIVSGLHRSIPGAAQVSAALVDLIQTDAAISPGNSGGALVNGQGEVVGVNVAYIPPNSEAGAVSIGFAIPAPTVTDVVEQLLEDGTAEHAYIGVRPATLTPQLAQELDVEADHGVVILAVEEGGPAAQAGIEPGDVVTAVDGGRVETVEDLLAALREHRPGDQVTLTVVRGGSEQDVTVTVGELPPVG